MVVPLERRATPQRARKDASRPGFDALARNTLLRALQMRYGHLARRAPRLRTSASETRLMRIIETGSGQECCVLFANALGLCQTPVLSAFA